MLQYRALGSLQVECNGCPRTPTRPKPRQVLALLLMRANRTVPTGAIIHELWDERPPRSAVATIQSYIHHIRRKLGDGDLTLAAQEILITCAQGYLLKVDPEGLDSQCFTERLPLARRALEDGHIAGAEGHASSALSLWGAGSALDNVAKGPLLTSHIAHLEESRIAALELSMEAALKLGRHRDVLGELRYLVESYPLNERFRGLLICALHRSGRRCEALEEYARTRQMLIEEFGLEPDGELRSIQRDVLAVST